MRPRIHAAIRKQSTILCRFAAPLFVIVVFLNCSNPLMPAQHAEIPFVIDGIQFPNDSIFKRAFTPNSLWRMHQFINKCKANSAVRIGFIGGSITAGALASDTNHRFSSLFCSSLKYCFSNLKNVIEINAGIGATTSRFGCSRVNPDLLSFLPDLIVIDFAVNDYGDSAFIEGSYEGLIRQCLLYRNDVPIVLLFFSNGHGDITDQLLESYVGNHYALPMISYRDAIWPLIRDSLTPLNTFFANDFLHPNDNGHRVCASLLYSFLQYALASPESLYPEIPIPAVLFSYVYQYAGIMSSSDTFMYVQQQNGWKSILKEKGRIGYQTDPAGNTSSLLLTTRCREVTLGIHMHPRDTSSIIVSVDTVRFDAMNDYSAADYTQFLQLYSTESRERHTIRIDHTGASPYTIDYILYGGKP